MSARMLGLGVLLVGVITLTGPAWADEKEPTGKLVQKLFEKETPAIKVDYLLYLPGDYGKEEKAWPLVLFLHGKGDKIDRMKRGGLPGQIERKKEDRFILVAPECAANFGWS